MDAQSDTVLSRAFEELAHALEELQAADQALHRQRDEWLNKQAELELENQRYKDLFEHAPAGYVVTSIDGAIRQANPAALALLETTDRAIVGRSLAVFRARWTAARISREDRRVAANDCAAGPG